VQLQPLTLTALILLTLPAGGLPLATTICPTHRTVIAVDSVDATPKIATPGATITLTFRATYPEGTPAQVSRASFIWSGTAAQEEFDNAGVAPNGSAGFYQYRQQVTTDLIHTVGRGHTTVSIIACSLHDPLGNDGPNQNTGTQVTLTQNREHAERQDLAHTP
jgi:hypothetical protein